MPDLVDGRYELLDVLASGGMATVWRARDTRLDRLVALKRPHPAPPDDPIQARLDREARAAAALNHPHLVTIYDVGRDEAGPYLVMELVEGPTLATVGGELDARRSVEIGAQLAEALSTVHAAGIVHRDVKPANVLMSDRGPQLTDFGIALEGDPSGRLTQPGSVVATPFYASPEQLAGHPATPKSDVFSLAVLIYELVSGRLPFPGVDRSAPPPPVGDAGLNELLGRALSTEPDQRPDAAELARSLRAAAPTVTYPAGGGSTVPLAAIPTDEPIRSEDTPERRPWVLGGVAAVAAVGLAALALATADDDTPAGAAGTTPPTLLVTTAPSTTAVVTSTAAPETTTTTTTTTVPPTTPSTAEANEVEEARNDLEEALSAPHPSDLNPNEARELMEKADEAIRAVEEDEDQEAGQKLREIARAIDDRLENEERHLALERLVHLADVLGVPLSEDDDGDDGDDDDDD